MKNTMVIDATSSCLCSLVCSINDGTARLFLNIESDLSLNPYLEISGTNVTITANPFSYEIARSLWNGSGTLKFRIIDDHHNGNYFSISKIGKYNETLKLNQIDNFNYEFSIYEEPITVEELDEKITKVDSNVKTLGTNFSNYKNSSDKNFTDIENNFKTVNTNYTNMDDRVGDNESSIKSLIEDLGEVSNDVNGIINKIYPVGSIYMSVNSTNPSSYFGGTWVAWGSGRVPVGVQSGDENFGTVEQTGGEKRHWLSLDEIPTHTHDIKVANGSTSGDEYFSVTQAQGGTYKTYSKAVLAAGGNSSHNNIQPYITCYMWKRTK